MKLFTILILSGGEGRGEESNAGRPSRLVSRENNKPGARSVSLELVQNLTLDIDLTSYKSFNRLLCGR